MLPAISRARIVTVCCPSARLFSSSGLVQRDTRARPGGESAPERIVYATAMRGTARARSEIRVCILSEEEPQEHHES